MRGERGEGVRGEGLREGCMLAFGWKLKPAVGVMAVEGTAVAVMEGVVAYSDGGGGDGGGGAGSGDGCGGDGGVDARRLARDATWA